VRDQAADQPGPQRVRIDSAYAAGIAMASTSGVDRMLAVSEFASAGHGPESKNSR
jgi:hypothetical protein